MEDGFGATDLLPVGRVARALGMSIKNLRALERRGRLPEGCEPQVDLITGMRGWTPEQLERLKEWNAERVRQAHGEEESGDHDEND